MYPATFYFFPDLGHVTAENFMEELENGVSICKLANIVNRKAEEAKLEGKSVGQVGQITLLSLRLNCISLKSKRQLYLQPNQL